MWPELSATTTLFAVLDSQSTGVTLTYAMVSTVELITRAANIRQMKRNLKVTANKHSFQELTKESLRSLCQQCAGLFYLTWSLIKTEINDGTIGADPVMSFIEAV